MSPATEGPTLAEREHMAQLARTGRTDELLARVAVTGPDVIDSNGNSLLMLAAYHGHAATVTALLARGADPALRDARGLSPLDGAAFKGDPAVIGALLDAGADPNAGGPDGRTPLMWAAAFNRAAAVRLLLQRGARAELTDRSGMTAARHAETMGAPDTAPLLRAA